MVSVDGKQIVLMVSVDGKQIVLMVSVDGKRQVSSPYGLQCGHKATLMKKKKN